MDGQLLKQSEFKRILYFVAVPAEDFLLCDRNLEKAHFKCTRNGAILLLQIFALYFFFCFTNRRRTVARLDKEMLLVCSCHKVAWLKTISVSSDCCATPAGEWSTIHYVDFKLLKANLAT